MEALTAECMAESFHEMLPDAPMDNFPENPEYPRFAITDCGHVYVWGVVTYAIHKV